MDVASDRVRGVLALMAAVAGCAGAAVVYLGLVDAVPIVDFNTDLDRQLRREGARQVLLGGLPVGLAGALLIAGGAKWTGGIVIGCACLLMLLAFAKSPASWALLAIVVLVGLVGCVRLLTPSRSR
jgi:hypothetical protein